MMAPPPELAGELPAAEPEVVVEEPQPETPVLPAKEE